MVGLTQAGERDSHQLPQQGSSCHQGSGANAVILGNDRQMSRLVPVEEMFKGRHFDQEIVVLCVRWYLSFKLSFRDLVAIISERDLKMAHNDSAVGTTLLSGV